MLSRSLRGLIALGLTCTVGCNAGFWPAATVKKKVDTYTAVRSGMSEKQVIRLLGEPSSRRGTTLEGVGRPATSLTWVGHHKLITVVLVDGAVVAKQKI